MNISFPTKAQFASFGRHVVSYAAGAVTVAVGLHFVTPDQGTQLGDAVKGIASGVASIYGGVSTLFSIGTALYAAWTASPSNQAAAIGANPSTLVQPASNGTATVTLKNPAMASAALDAQKKAA
jgi:hypothetical protein